VENTLHREFAHLRIPGGEWFQLDELTLGQAIERCQSLAALHESYVPIFAAATAYETTTELGPALPANNAALEWQRAHRFARIGFNAIERVFDRYKDLLERLHLDNIDIRKYASVTTERGRQKLNDNLFREQHPGLASATTIVNPAKRSAIRVLKLPDEMPLKAQLPREIAATTAQLDLLLEQYPPTTAHLDEMHASYFSLRILQGIYEAEEMIAAAHLMVLCKASSGIESVCGWGVTASTTVLDKKALKRDYPNEYDECVVEGDPFPSVTPTKGWISLAELG
jgi:hypothetical protein